MQKEQLNFGHGSFVGAIMQDPTFFDLPVRDQARVLGWADGCPVVTELTDPENMAPGRGPENMRNRYGEVSYWFGEISRMVAEVNPKLHEQLIHPVQRLATEPAGKYEPESVPTSHLGEIAPMGTLAGYALSRIFIEQMGGKEELPQSERQARLFTGLDELHAAAANSRTPTGLLMQFGERLVIHGNLTPDKVLKHALSQGWLEEHNGYSMIAELKNNMHNNSIELYNFYADLDPEAKAKLRLA